MKDKMSVSEIVIFGFIFLGLAAIALTFLYGVVQILMWVFSDESAKAIGGWIKSLTEAAS